MISSRLASIRNVLSNGMPARPKITLATGNQSGDMDSVVCAIVHSVFNNVYCNKTTKNRLVIPFLNLWKKDLKLRKDIMLCLERAKIDLDSLFFIDDLGKDGIIGLDAIVDVVLLDHNTPQGSIQKLLKENSNIKVSGIIDHHEDENKYLYAQPRIIAKTGSCSSLVWDYWRETVMLRPQALGDTGEVKDVIGLLSAALILDTTNCTSKMEETDWIALKTYKQLIGESDATTSSFDDWYRDLYDAKIDISGLTIHQILVKDYKCFEMQVGTAPEPLRLGISSMVRSFEWLLEQQEGSDGLGKFEQEVLEFIKENDLDASMIMTAYVDPKSNEFQRQLIVITNDLKTSILLRLVINEVSEKLQLSEIPLDTDRQDDEVPLIKCYNQANLGGSRKVVSPIIKEALERL